ncbi:hypothetical protein IC235_04530 [Hymenobacter sp. BT664]|uniref:Uncharacterized protein n=1 Tax=Hymenobacter montanus TaxID=2771359 RepID=A0A927BBB4_9BACT|nr:hypothetical protein [Hymenobacter montanus]MBD2767160.1 hypothetical protein [Hymenobacter montanus]
MHFAFYTRWLWLGLLAVAFVGSMSGCQSTRPSFSFQPAPRRAAPAVDTGAVRIERAQVASVPVAEPAVAVAPRSTFLRPRVRVRRPVSAPQVLVTDASVVSSPVVRPASTPRRRLWARPQAPAEVGLGTTVLGVLGLVTLPIALVGLALSGGGLVWGIIAGAAALAVLVAYIDPFGG